MESISNANMPVNFKPAIGVKYAEFTTQPEFIKREKLKGARQQGVVYEKRAQQMLTARYGKQYLESPWVKFRTASDASWRWCQPDGLIVDIRAGKIVIVEVKYRHLAQAWWQIFLLYMPVLQAMFPARHWEYGMVEVCKWYDPATSTPMRPVLRERIIDARPGEFSVHIWRPHGE